MVKRSDVNDGWSTQYPGGHISTQLSVEIDMPTLIYPVWLQ